MYLDSFMFQGLWRINLKSFHRFYNTPPLLDSTKWTRDIPEHSSLIAPPLNMRWHAKKDKLKERMNIDTERTAGFLCRPPNTFPCC